VGGCVDVWMDGCVDGWMVGWLGGWVVGLGADVRVSARECGEWCKLALERDPLRQASAVNCILRICFAPFFFHSASLSSSRAPCRRLNVYFIVFI